MGALTYHPPADEADEPSLLDLDELAHQAEEVLSGTADEVLPELERAGGSPGGARPKVVVGVKGSQVMTGDVDLPEGFEHWLVKFSAKADLARNGPVEHAYMRMAEAAGITVPPTRLFTRARHFGVRRFDRRPGNRRIHMHTFGNMIHSDFRVPSVDYDTLLRVTGALTRDQRAVEETFRRMVFNLAAHNRDDHVKNFAFLMDASGAWNLAPAYDVAYAESAEWTRQHQMSINGKFREIMLDELLAVGATFDVPGDGRPLIDAVMRALESWRTYAAEAGVPIPVVDHLERRFERW
jgi:serine/threonine-protein kinase HipA